MKRILAIALTLAACSAPLSTEVTQHSDGTYSCDNGLVLVAELDPDYTLTCVTQDRADYIECVVANAPMDRHCEVILQPAR